MYADLTIIRYPRWFIPMALLAMAIHRLPLWRNKTIGFYKLLGSGKNGTFDKVPDLQQWGIFSLRKAEVEVSEANVLRSLYGKFISVWFRLFNCETFTILLRARQGHGEWDGKELFKGVRPLNEDQGRIATLTRATIRARKLKYFWRNVAPAASGMVDANGFVCSFGIGEVPWIKQATFSVWESEEQMKNFAYSMREHAEVIKKTREGNWYSEELFARFDILGSFGTVKGINPLHK